MVFHAMHRGWADTPGIRSGLPGFAKVMGPILRTPDQGADTAVWLAAAPRRPRPASVLESPPSPLGAQGPVDHLSEDAFAAAGTTCGPGSVRCGWDGLA